MWRAWEAASVSLSNARAVLPARTPSREQHARRSGVRRIDNLVVSDYRRRSFRCGRTRKLASMPILDLVPSKEFREREGEGQERMALK